MFHLLFPNFLHKKAYIDMIDEWKSSEFTPTSPRRLFSGDTYEEFISIITTDLTDNPRGVNSTLFFFMESEDILGAIQIRHHIDHPDLRDSGGHIGYGLRPSARGRGYAKHMLALGLDEARKIGLKRVLLSADDDNTASWKTIEANGGIFDRMTEKNGKLLRIYWISL
ncbi:GNAT family N-acetyltransferase [Candidatus Gracilibacteria bacterium]|nr:GNAT family N-acetyltransferase [Candidatus Gracilibacteria bacterium]